MGQKLYLNIGDNKASEIELENFSLPPVLMDIEHIIYLFLLSNKALSLPETQTKLLADENFSSIIKNYNSLTGLNISLGQTGVEYETKMNISKQMVFLGKAMSILMYDYILASKYNSGLNNLNEIQFLKFIRNGASHNNQFNLKDEKGDWKIGEGPFWFDEKLFHSGGPWNGGFYGVGIAEPQKFISRDVITEYMYEEDGHYPQLIYTIPGFFAPGHASVYRRDNGEVAIVLGAKYSQNNMDYRRGVYILPIGSADGDLTVFMSHPKLDLLEESFDAE